jgi:7-cyano-7-deazaguanine synthase
MISGATPAVVLLSGGLDSTTTLALAKEQGFLAYALTVRYGQRHSVELDAARRVADALGVAQHIVAGVDLSLFGGSALTDDIPVPKDNDPGQIGNDIPSTYVPARNTVFLSVALAWAEVLGAQDIFLGVNALDYSGYPDCRGEFVRAFEQLAGLATKAGVEGRMKLTVHTPLIDMTKREIVETGLRLGIDYSVTVSCYDPALEGEACGRCDACVLRRRGFDEAGVADPTRYRVAVQP